MPPAASEQGRVTSSKTEVLLLLMRTLDTANVNYSMPTMKKQCGHGKDGAAAAEESNVNESTKEAEAFVAAELAAMTAEGAEISAPGGKPELAQLAASGGLLAMLTSV